MTGVEGMADEVVGGRPLREGIGHVVQWPFGLEVAASQLGRCCGWEEERYCRCRCRCRLHLIVVIVAFDDYK